jgi:hypothetical protein
MNQRILLPVQHPGLAHNCGTCSRSVWLGSQLICGHPLTPEVVTYLADVADLDAEGFPQTATPCPEWSAAWD